MRKKERLLQLKQKKISSKKKPVIRSEISQNNKVIGQQTEKRSQDQRFEIVSYDPRFLKVPKKISKVKVDKRFSKMMTDDSFKLVTKVDKYGRRIPTTKYNKQLENFYYQDQENEEEDDGNYRIDFEKESNQSGQLLKGRDRNIRQWMENYSEESSQTDAELEQQNDTEKELWSDEEDCKIKGQDVKATKRLALCNYDWMNISANDLMLLFNSFRPQSGFISKVQVYPSEIGIKRLHEQEVNGPQGIWTNNENNQEKILKQKEKESINFDKLRQYERERLRYYYAIIYCDSKETAEQIYKGCDGKELQNEGLLDLRFVPDQLTFPYEPKEVCTELPAKGEVKSNINRAVGHSKVKLTWEDPELNTIAGLKKRNWAKMTEKQLAQVDWSLYLNNDDVEVNQKQVADQNNCQEVSFSQDEKDDFELPAWKQQYHKLSRKNQPKEQMQITFNSGFNLSEKINVKNQQKKMSAYSIYMKKRKQKRAKFIQQKKNKKNQERVERELEQIDQRDHQKQRSKLELLIDKKKKEEFVVNVNDTRFADVFSNPLYSIDPTSQHFKATKNTKMLGEVVKRKRGKA